MKLPRVIGSFNNDILRLAIPSILANITTPLLALVDTAIVGHMGSPLYIAAIGIGAVMFNMMYWLFDFLRAGTSGLTAQACGSGDMHQASLVLYRSLLVSFVLGITAIALQWPLFVLLSWFLDPGTTRSAVWTYFAILVYGAPATLASYSLAGWYLGMQNSRMLLWTSILVNVVNITASLLLVYLLHLGLRGVAAGSLIAQWGGLLFGLACLRRYPLVAPRWRDILRWRQLRHFFSVNIDVMLRTACIIAVTVYFTRKGSEQGTLILAVNTLLMQFFYIFSYLMDGFAYAAEAIIGRLWGSRQYAQVRRYTRALMGWGIAGAILFSLIFYFAGGLLLTLLSDNPEVIDRAHDYYRWTILIPLAGFAAFVWDGIYIGAMLTRRMLLATFGAMLIFFGAYLLLYPHLANHGLWLAFILYLAARGILQSLLTPHLKTST